MILLWRNILKKIEVESSSNGNLKKEKKDLYLQNYNNSRHVICPKILVVALSVSKNMKNTKARVK